MKTRILLLKLPTLKGALCFALCVAGTACSTPVRPPGAFLPTGDARPSGSRTLVAPSVSCRVDGVPIVGAAFNSPYGVAVDGDGNVSVADHNGNAITKVAPPFTGPKCGSVTKISWQITYPYGVAADALGNRYFTEEPEGQNAASVWKIAAHGKRTPLAFGAGFARPWGIAADRKGNVYISDIGNGEIIKLSTNEVNTVIASGFNRPYSVAVDSHGSVYVADTFGDAIYKITAGKKTKIGPSFRRPYGVAVDRKLNVYVATGGAVKRIATDGSITTVAKGFGWPVGIAFDAKGMMFVADAGDNVVYRIAP